MRVLIVHDTLTHIGGAEKVLITLLRMYPRADVCIGAVRQDLKKSLVEHHHGNVRSLITISNKKYLRYLSLLKPLFYLFWKCISTKPYNVVISSSHSFSAKSIRASSPTKHIAYIHTPPRYLYSIFNDMRILQNPFMRLLVTPLLFVIKNVDRYDARKPDLLIANSRAVQKRIKSYYNRQSIVIYPPIIGQKQRSQAKSKSYYLFFSRIVRQKGVYLAVKTCTRHNIPLVVVGTGSELEHVKKIAGPSIVFTGFLSKSVMPRVFKHSKALLFPAIEEDFGMVAVEALAHGVPVIGYKSGGIPETIVHKKTGVLFTDYTIQGLKAAIDTFESSSIRSADCYNQAKRFDENQFRSKLHQAVSSQFPTKTL